MKNRRSVECDNCGRSLTYDERRDAYACLVCDLWSEPACEDRECVFCPGRAAKPSQEPTK